MKRKTYETTREVKKDQAIGFILFPIANIPFWLVINWLLDWTGGAYRGRPTEDLLGFVLTLLPWILNGIALAFMLFLRPHLAIGYLAFVVAAVSGVVIMAVFSLPACFVALVAAGLLAPIGGEALAGMVFFGIMLGGLALPFLFMIFMWWVWK